MGRIRLSAADWCFFGKAGLTPEEYYRKLHDLGYEAVEMTASVHRQAARDAGLKVLNLCGPGMQQGLNRLDNHAALLPQIRKTITEAEIDRIPYVVIFSGNRNGQPDAEGIQNCIMGIKQVADDAAKAGVTLLFEMLNSKEHADYQADSAAYGFEIVKRIDSPAVKVVYDIYHMVRMGEDAIKDVTANLDRIAHLHVAESPDRTKPLADGTMHYREIVREIMRSGYTGYWGMEFLPGERVLSELEEASSEFSSFVENL